MNLESGKPPRPRKSHPKTKDVIKAEDTLLEMEDKVAEEEAAKEAIKAEKQLLRTPLLLRSQQLKMPSRLRSKPLRMLPRKLPKK